MIDLQSQGFKTYLVLIIQLKGTKTFTPNIDTDKEFANALLNAKNNGVTLKAFDCIVTENSLVLDKEIKIVL